MAEADRRHRLDSVVLDEVSLAPASPEQEHERKIAISDLIAANYFEPADAPGGPYRLRIGLVDDVYPHARLMEEAFNLAGRIAVNPYLSVRHAKRLIKMYWNWNRTEG